MYNDFGCCIIHQAQDETTPLISDAELEEWVLRIYDNGTGEIYMPAVRKLADAYWEAVKNGYGGDTVDFNENSVDFNMLKRLNTDCYTFSAAKNRTHLQMLTALINDNGKVREFSAYKAEAQKLNLKMNGTWFKTEYDLAIAGATMASKWVQFEKTPGQMLRYTTVGDARVRDSHRQLNGITRPVEDKFWNTNYPPNGFKCRCDVDRLPFNATATADDKLPLVDDTVPEMFRTNLAKEQLVFPKNHPYYTQASTK